MKRSLSHQRQVETKRSADSKKFDYGLDYRSLDLRKSPTLYRVGVGEQGVLLVEPYKSEILPLWRFKTPAIAQESAKEITRLFHEYQKAEDFVGMDMCRKFLQMGFTRSRRYANHASGRKYDIDGAQLKFENDAVKAASAEIFWTAWQAVEGDPVYLLMKASWRHAFG